MSGTMRYREHVTTRSGRIRDGVVVLDEPLDAPDGTRVTVTLESAEDAITVNEEELAAIDAGRAEARTPARIDARAFVQAIRTGG